MTATISTQKTSTSNNQQQPGVDESAEIKTSLDLVRDETGWGSVLITMKNGKIDEIAVTITRKPRPQA